MGIARQLKLIGLIIGVVIYWVNPMQNEFLRYVKMMDYEEERVKLIIKDLSLHS